ncbi:MAG: methyltransferase domain-containing protein [Gemmatimonadales bacterium]
MLRTARDLVYRVLYRGTGRWCPVCEQPSRRFRPFGVDERRDEAMCVHCGALERHRLLWLFFNRMTKLFAGSRGSTGFLHVAPERCFEPRLRKRLGAGYLTADLEDPGADVRMDVTRIEYPDASFDVVYCSHVLEHVPDDRRALREFHRVLRRDGWAIILVPITVAATVEDPTETDPKERLRRFGQDDHFRRYGPDFLDRLRAAGFNVRVVGVAEVASSAEASLMGLTQASGEIYYCTKR